MRKAFWLFAFVALTACTQSPSPPVTGPAKGSIQANPQLVTGEKALPGMEGLEWSTAESGIHADQKGMLAQITIEGCLFSRQARTQNWPVTGPRLDGIYLEYIGPNTDFEACVQKVTAYFMDRLGPNPLLLGDNERWWLGLTSDIALGISTEKHTYSYIFEDKKRFSISYVPAGTLVDRYKVEV